MEINDKVKQAIIEKVYTRYYLSLLTYGSDQQIADELGSDVLAVHKKGTDIRKSALENRREERSKKMEERRAQRETEREERRKEREEKKELRQKERDAVILGRNLPISVLSSLSIHAEEEEESFSDEE